MEKEKVIKIILHLKTNYLKSIKYSSKGKNVFVWPYSLLTAVNMYTFGLRNSKEKFQGIKLLPKSFKNSSNVAIHINDSLLLQHKNDCELNTVNMFYLAHDIAESKKNLADLLRKLYKIDIEFIDFKDMKSSLNKINDSMAMLTNNKIKNILNESFFNLTQSLFLVNCVYFQGLWASSFNKGLTTKKSFYLRNGSVKFIDMMTRTNLKLNCIHDYKFLNASVCELPYFDNKLSMTIILPHEGISIDSVETLLSIDVLKGIFEKNQNLFKVNLIIPKFKLEQSLEVSLLYNYLIIFLTLRYFCKGLRVVTEHSFK